MNQETTEEDHQKPTDKVLLKLILKLGLTMFAILAVAALFIGSIIALGIWKALSTGTFVD